MSFPSDLVRTKNWGSEVLTDSDLEGQLDLIINWVMAAFNASTGHTHSGSGNNGPLLSSSAVTTTFGNGFTTVTAASGDYVMVASDVSDSNKTKKALVSDIVTLATPTAAAQSDQKTATSTTLMVTPGRQQYHPSAAKAWCVFNGATTGTNAPTAGYNVTSVQRVSTGEYIITFTTSFSSANYVMVGSAQDTGSTNMTFVCISNTTGLTTGSARITVVNYASTLKDSAIVTVVFYGDQ